MYTLETNKVYDTLKLEEKWQLLDLILNYEKHTKKNPLSEFTKYAESSIVNVIFWTIKNNITRAITEKKKTEDNRTIEGLFEWLSDNDKLLFWPWKEWFIRYWWEKNTKGKEKRQLQKTFDLRMRLGTWKKNNYDKIIDYTIIDEFDKWMRNGKMDEMKKQLWIDKYNEVKEGWKETKFNCR